MESIEYTRKIASKRAVAFLKSKEMILFYVFIAICAGITCINPVFISLDNVLTVIKQTTVVTIIAIGQTFVISSGGIDLSVGYVMATSSVLLAIFLSMGVAFVPAMLIGIAASTLLGTLNGVMVTKLRLPPFIITLGMSNIARGLVLVMTQGFVVQVKNPLLTTLGMGTVGPVPIMAVFMPVAVLIGWYLLTKTVFGNHVIAIGGNEVAAQLSGIHVHKKKILVYMLTGIFCGVAGVLMTGRLNGGNPNAGLTTDMDTIGAVIVGGTSLKGGSGTIIGTMLGALLMGVIRNGLVLVNVDMYWQTVVTGVIVIAVCASKELLKKQA